MGVLASGLLMDRRYRLEELVGRGGMAEVYRATDTEGDRPVAVKLLRDVEAADVRRFHVEVAVLGRLDHPGVVRLYGTGSHEGVPYLVLELVEGPSLADELVAGPLGAERSVSVARQLADALAHAHGLGVVHRDLKPANILFDAEGRVRLADFGIARLADLGVSVTGMTAPGMVVGTMPYLAPEQVEGRRVGAPADVYTLGLVTLECLTGARCYPGGRIEAAVARLHRPPDIPAGLPAWLREVLAAMTTCEPRWRPCADAAAAAFASRSADPVLAATAGLARPLETTVLSRPRRLGVGDQGRSRRALTLAAAGVALAVPAWLFANGDGPLGDPSATPGSTPANQTPTPGPSSTPQAPTRVEPVATTLPSPGEGDDQLDDGHPAPGHEERGGKDKKDDGGGGNGGGKGRGGDG
jgi:serine/threonine protein kinase